MPLGNSCAVGRRGRVVARVLLCLLPSLTGCSVLPNGGLGDLRPDSYLAEVLLAGQYVVHFDEMPVRVKIDTFAPPPGYKALYREQVVDGLSQWEAASAGALTLQEVEMFPDITVYWVAEIPGDTPATGVTTITYSQTCFTPPLVELATDLGGQPISDAEMDATAIHELGHAIGIAGHSSGVGDVMHASSHATELSAADTATLLDLYSRPTERVKCSASAAGAGWRTLVIP